MSNRRKVLHYRTSGTTMPSNDELEIGEISLNFSNDNPRLFIKKANNEVAEFVDKSYTDGKLNEKQDVISDLDKIRSNAEGIENAVTKTEVEDLTNIANNALLKKNVATVNGKSLINGGNVVIDNTLYEMVDELPETPGNPNKLYIVASSSGAKQYQWSKTNESWTYMGVVSTSVDMSKYITITDADKRYMKANGASSTTASISLSTNGSFNNFGNNGQAFNAVRDVTETSGNTVWSGETGSGYKINAASFGIKVEGTTSFSHKKYNSFNKETGAYTGAQNTAVLMFSGKSGLMYGKNTGSGNDLTPAMYKYVGVIDSPDDKQKVYSAKQVDDMLQSLYESLTSTMTSAISETPSKTVIDNTSKTTDTLSVQPNTVYNYGTVTSLTISSIPMSNEQSYIYFIAGENCSIVMPDVVIVGAKTEYVKGKAYMFEIVGGAIIISLG